MPPQTKGADVPDDPFKRGIYVFDKLTDLISHLQMISKTFLKPKRALRDIYDANAFRQLADDVSKEFGIQISSAEVRKAETLEGLSLAIVDKLSDK
jgi:hypothetical protein